MAKYTKENRPPPTPKQPKLWDPPPEPIQGDKKENDTYAAVGRALSMWEEFEHSFATLFADLLGLHGEAMPVMRAYGAVLTFRGRLEMVEAAREALFFEYPNERLAKRTKDLLEMATGLSARRNEVAHGIVRNIHVQGPGVAIPNGAMYRPLKRWGFGLVPSMYATNKTTLAVGETFLSPTQTKPKYTYTSAEIIGFTGKFATLNANTIEAAQYVRDHWDEVTTSASS